MTFFPITNRGAPNCPLCGRRFKQVVTDDGDFYVCTIDMISINVIKGCARDSKGF